MDIECVSTSFAVKFTVIAMGILEYSLFYYQWSFWAYGN